MNISLAKILPNPYRDFDVHPINDDLVARLAASIDELSYWKGIVVRKVAGGKYEQAFGHHRVEALKKAGKKTAEFDVVDFDDDQMAKAMVIENASQQGGSPTSVLDNIKAANLSIGFHLLTSEKSVQNFASSFPSQQSWANARTEFKKGKGLGRTAIYRYADGNMTRNEIEDGLKVFEESNLLSKTMQEIHLKIDRLVAEKEEEERKARTKEEKEKAEKERKEAEAASEEAETIVEQASDPTFDYNVAKLFERDSHLEAFRKMVTSENGLHYLPISAQYEAAEQVIDYLAEKGKTYQEQNPGKQKNFLTSTGIAEATSTAIANAARQKKKVEKQQKAITAASRLSKVYADLNRLNTSIEKFEELVDSGVLPDIDQVRAIEVSDRIEHLTSKLSDVSDVIAPLTKRRVIDA